jgi:hypothetical protein
MSQYISQDTLEDFFKELGETEAVCLLAQQKLAAITRKPLTAACRENHGTSQKAKT